MDQTELLSFLIDVLERLQLPYAITGSHASISYSEARFTNDIDVVVDLAPNTLAAFCAAFPDSEFYVSQDGARHAAARGGQFNIIHPESGIKIDVIVPDSDLGRAQLDRAVRAPTTGGRTALLLAPEDLIIQKMKAYEEGGSEKHLRDITGVLKIMGQRVDRSYIEKWTSTLGYEEIWNAILKRLAQ
jgi:hypothetical protein